MLTSSTATIAYRLRAGTKADSYGDLVESWAPADVTRTRIRGASVQPPQTSEVTLLTGVKLSADRILLATGRVDLTATDRVEHKGEVYRIDGDPVTLPSLASGVLTVANLVRIVVR